MSELWWFILGGVAVAAVLALVAVSRHLHRRRRIVSMVEFLEAASSGNEAVLTATEDEFSILEDELYKTVGELRVAREQAQKEREQQAENLADIAHQLKTPITSMSLMTQLLAEEATEAQQDYLVRLGGQLTRLSWLTSSLLTMSRLDAGAVDFVRDSTSFEALAFGSCEAIDSLLLGRGQQLVVQGGGQVLDCDSHWTGEALLNLVKNCSEHTPQGGSITLACNETPLYVQITIEDSGSGFVPKDIPHLFRRFYRGKNSHKDSVGIGLALSRAIVEGQGGTLRAENRPEGGARFIIRFYP